MNYTFTHSLTSRLFIPANHALRNGHHRPLRPNMHRLGPIQPLDQAALHTNHLHALPLMPNPRAAPLTEVTSHQPGLRRSRERAELREHVCWEIGAREDRGRSKGGRGLAAALEAVADIEAERGGEGRLEGDPPALAAHIHLGGKS